MVDGTVFKALVLALILAAAAAVADFDFETVLAEALPLPAASLDLAKSLELSPCSTQTLCAVKNDNYLVRVQSFSVLFDLGLFEQNQSTGASIPNVLTLIGFF
uniref:Uncharacterized protein n=1 Tax=Tetranychus urticae TaxID=32264 RepID=T1L1A3_TETUR